jgi:hypothetical protein
MSRPIGTTTESVPNGDGDGDGDGGERASNSARCFLLKIWCVDPGRESRPRERARSNRGGDRRLEGEI